MWNPSIKKSSTLTSLQNRAPCCIRIVSFRTLVVCSIANLLSDPDSAMKPSKSVFLTSFLIPSLLQKHIRMKEKEKRKEKKKRREKRKRKKRKERYKKTGF